MKSIFKGSLVLLAFLFLGGMSRAQDQIWTSYTPSNPDANGSGGAVELGVQFSSDIAGTITAVRFYKSPANTGTHTGTLWSSTGTVLATGTFANETAAGWQQLNFATPVSIQAGTTYTASYHTTVEHYSANLNFTWPVYNAPLHGLAGTYVYGSGDAVPTSVWMGANYAVDVVFTPAPTSTPTPTPSPSSTCSCTASVSLSWLPATGAASYNVYRGTAASGPYSLLGSATQPGYTDNTVISGASYFYEISVAGLETYLALPVAVTIP
jgi:hypothetical protein